MSSISYAVDSDGIATLTIDQPGKSMNVVSPEFVNDSRRPSSVPPVTSQ